MNIPQVYLASAASATFGPRGEHAKPRAGEIAGRKEGGIFMGSIEKNHLQSSINHPYKSYLDQLMIDCR